MAHDGRVVATPLADRSDNNARRLSSDFMTSPKEFIVDDMTGGLNFVIGSFFVSNVGCYECVNRTLMLDLYQFTNLKFCWGLYVLVCSLEL